MGTVNVEEGTKREEKAARLREALRPILGKGRQSRVPHSLRTDLLLLVRYHGKQSNTIQRPSRSPLSVTR